MQLTLIFFFDKSIAKDLVKASTPPLLATYPGLRGKPNFAFILEILIIEEFLFINFSKIDK